jgi:hypothetical protein
MAERFLEWVAQNGYHAEFKVRAHLVSGQPYEVLEITGPQGERVVIAKPNREERLLPSQVAYLHRRLVRKPKPAG